MSPLFVSRRLRRRQRRRLHRRWRRIAATMQKRLPTSRRVIADAEQLVPKHSLTVGRRRTAAVALTGQYCLRLAQTRAQSSKTRTSRTVVATSFVPMHSHRVVAVIINLSTGRENSCLRALLLLVCKILPTSQPTYCGLPPCFQTVHFQQIRTVGNGARGRSVFTS